MKNNRYFFAVVLSVSLGACAEGVTEPPPMRTPEGPSALVAGDTTPTPPAPSPGEDPTYGTIGSGVGR